MILACELNKADKLIFFSPTKFLRDRRDILSQQPLCSEIKQPLDTNTFSKYKPLDQIVTTLLRGVLRDEGMVVGKKSYVSGEILTSYCMTSCSAKGAFLQTTFLTL